MTQAALIVGAHGGIGRALAQHWQNSERYTPILKTGRSPEPGDVQHALDFTKPESLRPFSDTVAALLPTKQLTTVAICSGILHGDDMQPERQLKTLDATAFHRAIQINALGPMLLIQHLLPLIPRYKPSRILAISARVGSIRDNRLGGWYSYRASKAALNQGFQTLKAELQRTHPQCVLTLFHPGTVDTKLSAPFQKNVPAEALFYPVRAAQQLDRILHARSNPKAHIFVDWAGKNIDF